MSCRCEGVRADGQPELAPRRYGALAGIAEVIGDVGGRRRGRLARQACLAISAISAVSGLPTSRVASMLKRPRCMPPTTTSSTLVARQLR